MINIKQSKPIERYGIRFDSQFELSVYEFLLTWFDPSDIRVHTKVTLFKATPLIDEISINVDFCIPSQDLWIEAKGDLGSVINDAFKVKYRLAGHVFPGFFARLIVVDSRGGRRLPAKGKNTINLPQLAKLFRELGLHRR